MNKSNLYRILGLSLILIAKSFSLNGQNQDFDKKNFLSGFHFSVSGNTGLSKFNFDVPTTITLKSPLLTQNSASIEVQYYFNKGLYLSSSLGYFLTTQKNFRKQGGMEWYNYSDGLAWIGYSKFDFGLGVSNILNSKFLLRPSIKVGGLHTRNTNPLRRTQDGSTIQATSKVNPYIMTQLNVGYIFKNYNVFELGLYYRHSFSNIYTGVYQDSPAPVAFSGTGTELGLNMGYTFTGFNRKLVKAKAKTKRGFQKYKKSRRKIEDSARLLEVSLGRFSYVHFIDDPKGVIVNSISNRIGVRVEAEFSLSNNKFWETGVHVGEYFTGYVLLDESKENKVRQRQAGPDYQAAVNIGYGYRMINRNEVNLITVSAGVTINGSLGGSSGSSSAFNPSTNEYIYLIEYEDDIKTIVYPSIYANLNKDFQIAKKTSLSLNFRYNQGIINSIVRNYEVQTYGSQTRSFTGVRNGTSYSLSVGVKYNFGEKEKSK